MCPAPRARRVAPLTFISVPVYSSSSLLLFISFLLHCTKFLLLFITFRLRFISFPLRFISFPLLFICFPLCCIRFLSAPKFLHSMRDLGVTDPSIFGRAGLSEISWGPSTGPSSREARYVISSTWPDIAPWRRTVEACVGFLSMANSGLHTLSLV